MSVRNRQERICDEAARTAVECKRALGWTAEKISAELRIDPRTVVAIFRAQDRLINEPDTLPHPRKPLKDACKHGHPFIPGNVRYRADGARECRECKNSGQRRRYVSKRAA